MPRLAASPTLGARIGGIILEDCLDSKSYTTPTDGGRVHLVLQGQLAALDCSSVKINKQEAMNLPYDKKDKNPPDFTYFDWSLHADTRQIFWISFHSRNKDGLTSDKPTLQVSITDDKAECYSGRTIECEGCCYCDVRHNCKQWLVFIVHLQQWDSKLYMINGVMVTMSQSPYLTIKLQL